MPNNKEKTTQSNKRTGYKEEGSHNLSHSLPSAPLSYNNMGVKPRDEKQFDAFVTGLSNLIKELREVQASAEQTQRLEKEFEAASRQTHSL